MSAESNRVIKGYELRERIGAGGFGEVYRAYQPTIDREVAIKVILPHHANQAEFIRNFENEARTIARLEHPHIVPLFDFWRDPSGAYLVMRWLRGGSLTQRLQTGALSLAETQKVTDHMTQALAIAHRNRVVHRDLKPDNILLDDDGNAYLTDFGIASVIGATQTNDSVSGSIHYISPEQLMSQKPSARMDIYSYGMMLYEILTGEYAYHDSSPSQIIQSHLHDPVPIIHDPTIPDGINDIIQKATAKNPADRYADIRDIFHALNQVIEPSTPSVPSDEIITELINPYKGLNAFGFGDTDDFFGRDTLVSQLLTRLKQQNLFNRFLAVIGPSGSGKSSVVRAGLIPRLWEGALPGSENWFYTDMVPGNNPIEQLTASLLSIAVNPPSHMNEMLTANDAGLLWTVDRILTDKTSDLILFIDQFEELFTLVTDEGIREQFLQLLYTAITAEDSRLRVVITLRADFTDRPLLYSDFGELIRDRSEFILPLKPAEIEQAITGPAHRVGLQVDSELVATMVSDIHEEPGALPLLQFVLTELYERRNGNQMTLSAYQQLGGVRGALAMRVEEAYQNLPNLFRPVARQIFLRLIALGEGTEDTRRRVLQSEVLTVSPDTDVIESIIEQFSRQRLLTTDRDPINRAPTLEVAHEALIREWDTLRLWLDESREDLRLQRVLLNTAQEWESAHRDASFLLRGGRLATFEEWIDESSVAVANLEREFLQASQDHRDKLAEEEAKRLEHERQLQTSNQRRLRLLVIGALGAAAIGFILTFLVVLQSQSAITSANEAGTQAAIAATSENLAVINAEEAQLQANIALTQIAIAETAQFDVEIEANRAQTQVALVSTAESEANQNAELAANNAGTADANAINALNNAQTATIAQGDALVQANLAQTQAAIATIAQGDALVQANLAQTQVALVSTAEWEANSNALDALNNAATATFAQGDALQQANNAQTQVALVSTAEAQANQNALLAENNAGTSDANAIDAVNNALTATIAQGEAIYQADLAVTQIAIAETAQFDMLLESTNVKIQADIAATARVDAVIQANSALTQAAIATVAQGEALIQANNAETQVALVSTAESNANANAQLAEDNALTAEANEMVAEDNAATAVAALEISEISERLARAQALVSSARQLLEIGNTDLALSLALEAANLNPNLIEAQTVLNQIISKSSIITIDRVSVLARDWLVADILQEIPEAGARFSPDGKYLLTVHNGSLTMKLWDIETLKIVHEMQGHIDKINDVEFSYDSQYIVSGSEDTSIVVWDVSSGQELYRLVEHLGPITDIEMHPTANIFASSDYIVTLGEWDSNGVNLTSGESQYTDGRTSIILWDITTGEKISPIQSYTGTFEIRFNPDGNTLVSWNGHYTGVFGWNTTTGKQRYLASRDFRGLDSQKRYAWSDGYPTQQGIGIDALATGEVIIWNINNNTEVRRLINGFDWRYDYARFVEFTSDGRSLLVGVTRYQQNEIGYFPSENRLIYFDIASGSVNNLYENKPIRNVSNARILSDNQTVLSIIDNNRLVLWDIVTGRVIREIGNSDQSFSYVNISPNEQYATTLSALGNLRLWDLQGLRNNLIKEVQSGKNVHSIGFSSDDNYIYAVDGSDLVSISIETGEEQKRIYMGNPINTASYSSSTTHALVSVKVDMRWLRTNGIGTPIPGDYYHELGGGEVVMIDMESGKIVKTYGQGTVDDPSQLANVIYSPDATYALVQNEFWDLQNHNIVTTLSEGGSASISPDNRYIAMPIRSIRNIYDPDNIHILIATESTYGLFIFSTETGEIIKELKGFTLLPNKTVFSPDGKTLLASMGSPDNSLVLWDVESGEVIRRFVGHTNGVNDVVISHDGRIALSASNDRTIILWDMLTGQPIQQYSGHTEPVVNVAFSHDGRKAVSTDGRTIIEWQIDSLEDMIDWVANNRTIYPLNCIQREQYNVRPLCEHKSVSMTQPGPTIVPTSFLEVEVLASSANVRSAPEASASIITSLKQGEIVDIIEITSYWYKIMWGDGQEGWISRQLVQRK